MAGVVQPPQPDFAAISHSFNALSTQFGRCENLPAINNGAQILDAIQLLRRDMNQRFREIDDRFDRLDARFAATEFNNLARLSNSAVTHHEIPLEPLHRIADDMPIPNFPQTIADIMSLDVAAANEILEALTASTAGNLAQKKRRIKLQIGLRLQVV